MVTVDPIMLGQTALCMKAEEYAGENIALANCIKQIILNSDYNCSLFNEGLERWKLEKKDSQPQEIQDRVCNFFETCILKK